MNIKRLIKNIKIKTNPEIDRVVLENLLGELDKSKNVHSADIKPSVWRIIMKNKITKLAVAAVLVVAAVISITVLDKSVTPAYALENTIKASRLALERTIRYVHYVWTYYENGKQEIKEEVWRKLDMKDTDLALRVDKGQRRVVTISEDHIRKEWNPNSNMFELRYEYTYPRKGNFRSKWREPALAALLLYEWEKLGQVSLKIDQPKNDKEPIRVTATYTQEYLKNNKSEVERQFVLLIDPQTQLVIQAEIYRPPFDGNSLQERYTFVEYNSPFDPSIFDLVQPEGAKVVDLTQDIGLDQGELKPEEIAREVVRQYIEALIAEDYEKATKLVSGLTPEQLKQWLEKIKVKFLRVVDIGIPELDQSGLPGYLVPFEYESEKDGVRSITGPPEAFSPSEQGPIEHRKAVVRPVPGHPKRWMITSGI